MRGDAILCNCAGATTSSSTSSTLNNVVAVYLGDQSSILMAPSRALTGLMQTAVRPLLGPVPTLYLPHHRALSAYGYEQAKCLVFPNHGEPKDVLRLHSHSISAPHSNLLTLRFLASPINPADINQIQGTYPTKPHFSTSLTSSEPLAVGGNEGVAELIAKGGAVKGVEKGDWVIMKRQAFGTWRTHAQTTMDELVVIKNREGLKPEQVATVSVNPMTAYRMLKDFVTLQPGEWFIQNGANSAVGRAAIQLAKLWGYKSLNVIRARKEGTEEMKQDLLSLGADVVVTDEELSSRDFRSRLKGLTNENREPIRLALNCVGGPLVTTMAKFLAPNSRVVTYGAMSKQPVTLPTGLLIFKNIAFDGFWVSRWSDANPDQKTACVEEVLDLTRKGTFRDVPMQPVKWDYGTKGDTLVEAVQGTLEGYRSGKGIFVFGET